MLKNTIPVLLYFVAVQASHAQLLHKSNTFTVLGDTILHLTTGGFDRDNSAGDAVSYRLIFTVTISPGLNH